MATSKCHATLDYNGFLTLPNAVEAVALPYLDDKPLYLTQFNLQEYVLTGFTMSIIWFICFFAIFFLFALLFSRNKFMEKPNRHDVRTTPLYRPRTQGQRIKTENENLDEANPKEDIIIGALRRLNSALTLRLAVNNPLGMLIIIIFSAIALTIFVISIATTMSQITVRNQGISTVDQIALRSQYDSPYLSFN
jgi:hypothetical protein